MRAVLIDKMMKVKVRARFNSAKERFEKYAEGMYLAYLPFPEESDSVDTIKEILAKKLFVQLKDISYMGVDARNDLLFVVG